MPNSMDPTALGAIFRLMAERIDERFTPPGYRPPQWSVRGNTAVLEWDLLGGIYTRGTTLVIKPAPPFIPLTEELRAEGWKRADHHLSGAPGWLLYTYLRDEETGAEIRVEAAEYYDAWPEKNGAVPFFADPPPPLPPARCGKRRREAWRAEYLEWERKYRADEW
ncbi:hypothetical protein [Nocardia abscessus]|uniref:hypothetical protein n=2 Tax=Nocardia TaxID=1817 RepID=UPI0024580548|nr:hypothetical protein [Nocardia abscessus]